LTTGTSSVTVTGSSTEAISVSVSFFSIFQSEFTALSAALKADWSWAAGLFVLGVVTIFVGFLVHMANMNLGAPQENTPRLRECPWKLGAMLLVAALVVTLGFWLPTPLYHLVQESARILGGAS
jgi:formate hydrogenlyase subunit 3/multisubunit Na+/H+ antiporter MnhD subunit